MLRIVKLNRLLRLSKLSKYLKYLEVILEFNPSFMRVLKLMVLMVGCCHWMGCAWWLVASVEAEGGEPEVQPHQKRDINFSSLRQRRPCVCR